MQQSLGSRLSICVFISFMLGAICAAIPLVASHWASNVPQMRDAYLNLHSQIMIFSVVIPLLPMTVGVYLLPRYLNTGSLLPPSLGRWVFYTYAAAIVCWASACLLPGSPQNWEQPVTFALSAGITEIAVAAAISLSAISVFLLAMSFLGTAFAAYRHQTRTPSQSPLVYGLLTWAGIQAVVSPFLALAVTIRLFEQYFHAGLIDPQMGGEPLVYQHLFWVYLHASLLASLLPAIGLVWSAVRSPERESKSLNRVAKASFITFGVTALLSWGTHLSIGESSPFVAGVFSLFALLTLIPLSYLIYNLVRDALGNYRRSAVVTIVSFMFVFFLMLGITTAAILAVLPTKVMTQGTLFATGHAHLFTIGLFPTALLVARERWFAQRGSARTAATWIKLTCYLAVLIGVEILVLPQLSSGLNGTLSYLRNPVDSSGFSITFLVGILTMLIGVIGLVLIYQRALRTIHEA